MENVTFKYKITKRANGYTECAKTLDELKFVHVIKGNAVWNINGKDIFVKPDDILVFCHLDKRYISSIPSEEELTVEQIVFQPITVSHVHNCAGFFFDRKDSFLNLLPKDNPYHAMILDDFKDIQRENGQNAPWKKEYITNPKHYIIESAHPSPFSARNGFFGSKPFSKTNEFLKKNNIKEIDWRVE